jgi:hypothetical protein
MPFLLKGGEGWRGVGKKEIDRGSADCYNRKNFLASGKRK